MQVYMGYVHYVCEVCGHYLRWMNNYLYRAGHRRMALLSCRISHIVASLASTFHYRDGIVLVDHWSFACCHLILCGCHPLNLPMIGNHLLLAQIFGLVLVIDTLLVLLVLKPLFGPQNLWIDSLAPQSCYSSPSFLNRLSFVDNSKTLEERLDFLRVGSRRRLCCCFGRRWSPEYHQIQWPPVLQP